MHIDFVGDVHGHADALKSLLRRLGYRVQGGAWRHPEGRLAVFVGDLIDRGPAQLETISIVRHMIDAGSARAVMGNHEFNAIGYATPALDGSGGHLRPRHGANTRHHGAFLDAAGGPDTELHRELIAFFLGLPLWLDFPGARVVHACWSGDAIAALRGTVDAGGRLSQAGVHAALSPGTAANAACEILLKGPEMTLPEGIWYRDAQGTKRTKTRTRWWDAEAVTLRTACAELAIAGQLPELALPPDSVVGLDESKPILFGHYWMAGAPFLLGPLRSCIDFSVAKGGVLCAYRFDGETALDASKLCWVGSAGSP